MNKKKIIKGGAIDDGVYIYDMQTDNAVKVFKQICNGKIKTFIAPVAGAQTRK